jgi:hypothetical protein
LLRGPARPPAAAGHRSRVRERACTRRPAALCRQQGNCAGLSSFFLTDGYRTANGSLGVAALAVPGLIGMFWGAPLAARELETGTFRLAWTQSVTRARWLAAKLGVAGLAADPAREHLACLRLIELLTGTHPRYLPGVLHLPATRTQHYSSFTLTMPDQLDLCLRRQARSLHSKASIDEPVTWEPPPGWITGIPWPGPDPDSISPGDLHPLIRARLPASAIAARLATTADHVLPAAARNPAPRLPGDPLTARSP